MTHLDIEVHNLQETVPYIQDGVDDLTKGCIIQTALLIVLNSMLHCQTTVKYNINNRGIGCGGLQQNLLA